MCEVAKLTHSAAKDSILKGDGKENRSDRLPRRSQEHDHWSCDNRE